MDSPIRTARNICGIILVLHFHYKFEGSYHIYKAFWIANLGEMLTCDKEESNILSVFVDNSLEI